MKKMMLVNIALFYMVLFTATAFAQGLLGKRYIDFEIGVVKPGDETTKEIDDTILVMETEINFPIDENLDFIMFFGHARMEGETSFIKMESKVIGFGGAILYHFMPYDQRMITDYAIDPFVSASFSYAEADATVNGSDISDDDTIFNIGGGIEIGLLENTTLTPLIRFLDIGDDSDEVSADLKLNTWINEAIGIFANLGYMFDDGDVSISGGLVLGF